jgi:hypothetical protein
VPVDIEKLRRSISDGTLLLRITTHAQVEAFKDGLSLADLRHVFENGRAIEEYEHRVLLYGRAVILTFPYIWSLKRALTKSCS